MSKREDMRQKTLQSLVVILAAAIVLFALPAWALGVAPEVTAQPDSVAVTWGGESDTGWFVWRSIEASSAEARALGFVTGNSFNDLTPVYGGKYYYSVAKPGALPTEWTVNSVSLAATTAPSPHVLATAKTETCIQCHALHGPTADDASVLADLGQTDKSVSGLCLVCHETAVGGGTSSVGEVFALAAGSGHTLAYLECSSCHDVHGQTTSNGSLTPDVVKNGGIESTVSTTANGWCLACHDGATAAGNGSDIVDIEGYPLTGTYPGRAVSEEPSANVHVGLKSPVPPSDIGRLDGSCLHCHASHRSASPYGGLLVVGDVVEGESTAIPGRFDGDDAPLCVTCHPDAGGASETAGHVVKTAGGAKEYPVGTPMPCFACHNPHGSSRGNALNLSDTLGQNLDPTAGDAEQRQFCFTCHTSEGYGWNSTEGTYTPVDVSFPDLQSVLGLDRADSANALSLESKAADGFHGYLGTTACSDCHASSHNPKTLVTDGLTSCFDCHSEFSGMDAASTESSSTYHHVLGTAGGSLVGGDLFLGSDDPTSTGTMYCVTCHTNHIKYPNSQGALRVSVTSTEGTTSEFGTSETSPGLCISCHDTILARDNSAQLLSTEPTVAAIGHLAYASSGHSYSVPYKGGAAIASCVKCHNSADAGSVPTNLIFFGLHTSSDASLIARLGANESDPKELCFQCHAQIGEVEAPIGKAKGERDWYNAVDMRPTATTYLSGDTTIGSIPHDSEMVFADVGPTGTGHYTEVCSACHDTHAENSISAKLAGTDWPLTNDSPTGSIPSSVIGNNGIRPIFLADVLGDSATTGITCFAVEACHNARTSGDDADMGGTAHTTLGHSSKPIACVDCHVPHIHGGASLTAQDLPLPAHQIMTWYDPLSLVAQPVADLYTFDSSLPADKASCTTNQANCHN